MAGKKVTKGINNDFLKEMNEHQVFQQIFNNSPISRSQIAKNIGLSKVTISNLVVNLLAENLVIEIGQGDSTSHGGRKPVMLEVNRDYGYVLNVEIGYNVIRLMANRITGDVLSFEEFEIETQHIQTVLNFIYQQVDLRIAKEKKLPFVGLSFAIHGTVFHHQIQQSPFLDFEGHDLRQLFQERYQVPVVVENEANLSVIFEKDFARVLEFSNIVSISVHKGIGAGIVINNVLYSGIHGEAGEIGQTGVLLDLNETDENLDTMIFHKIEDYCSEDAFLSQLAELKGETFRDSRSIAALMQEKDADVEQVVNRFCRNLALVVHNVKVSFAPEAIFLNSTILKDYPELFEQLRQQIERIDGLETQIQLSKNVEMATLLGGCTMIVHRVLKMNGFELNFVN